MTNRYLGLFCIGGIVFGCTVFGIKLGAHDMVDVGALICALLNSAVLGGIVWDAK